MKVEHRFEYGGFPGGYFVISAETEKDRELLMLFGWLSNPMVEDVLHEQWVPCIHGRTSDAKGDIDITLGMRKKAGGQS